MHAQDGHGALGAHARQRVVQGDVEGDGVDDAVRSAAAGVLEHRRDGRPLQRRGPGIHRQRATARDGVGGQHGARPLGERRAHRAEPDGAKADDDDRPTRRDVGLLRPDPPGRQIVRQQQRGLVVDAIGNRQELKVGVGHRNCGGLSPTEHAGAEDLHALYTRHRVARGAPGALPAPGDRRREHAVTDAHVRHLRPHFQDRADEFVTDGHPVADRQIAVVEVQIGSADRRRLDADHRSVCSRRDRVGGVADLDGTGTGDDDVAHRADATAGPGVTRRVTADFDAAGRLDLSRLRSPTVSTRARADHPGSRVDLPRRCWGRVISMNAFNEISKSTAAFFVQAGASFGVSFLGAIGGIYFLPLDPWQRLFLGMTVLFLVASSFTLAKVIRDQQEASTIRVRLDEARMEKLIAEHNPFSAA